MKHYINKHPSIILNQDIQHICNPLQRLNIDYFAHVLVTPDKQFSAIATSSGFTEHYLKHKYYNVDVHMEDKNLNNYIIEDMLELRGSTAELQREAAMFGVKHVFTIIEEDIEGKHCYHFGNSGDSMAINQTYLANFELLKAFIPYFKDKINVSKELAIGHQLKFQIESNAKGYQTSTDFQTMSDHDRQEYLRLINISSDISCNKNVILLNKTTNQLVKLSVQQSKCVNLLAAGYKNQHIAMTLGLSIRTVQHYIDRIRHLLDCTSSKELITLYHTKSA